MDEAARICARLLREGTVPRAELGALDHPDVRKDVESRLAAVGLTLATSAYSDHVGIRLSPDVTSDNAFDAASNLGLRADACALLVVLWARLVLQKRTVEDTREVPGQASLLDGDRADAARGFVPQVRISALSREFGKVLGSKTRLKALVSQLRRLGFLAGRGETIEAGPLLELGIDGEKMTAFVRRGVLARLLAEGESKPADPSEDPEAQILSVIGRLGGNASMADLERETHEKAVRLRRILEELATTGRIRKVGDRWKRRYVLVGG